LHQATVGGQRHWFRRWSFGKRENLARAFVQDSASSIVGHAILTGSVKPDRGGGPLAGDRRPTGSVWPAWTSDRPLNQEKTSTSSRSVDPVTGRIFIEAAAGPECVVGPRHRRGRGLKQRDAVHDNVAQGRQAQGLDVSVQ